MAIVKRSIVQAKLTVLLELDESEVRAPSGIFGYNVDHFLKVFYERMGKTYVQPHETGVRSLHNTIRGVLAGPIREMDKARTAMQEALKGER